MENLLHYIKVLELKIGVLQKRREKMAKDAIKNMNNWLRTNDYKYYFKYKEILNKIMKLDQSG